MTETAVWLTHEAHEQLRHELDTLLAQRSGPPTSVDSGNGGYRDQISVDEDTLAERRDRDQRIRRLQEILEHAVVGQQPPDDGIVEPGMVLTIRHGDESDTETLLLAAPEQQDAHSDLEICSPGSPLGQALSGARQGEQRQYQRPDGQVMLVSVVRAVPYGRRGRSH